MTDTTSPGLSPEQITAITQAFVDQGKLVEAGWLGFRLACWGATPNVPEAQLKECRQAFFAGAQHVFHSVMTMLEEGSEPTDADLRRMSNIDTELTAFLEAFKKEHGLSS